MGIAACELDRLIQDLDPIEVARSSRLEPEAPSDTEASGGPLTDRWYPCRLLPVQRRFLYSKRRFVVAAAGRRSFKTEGAKRRLVRKALSYVDRVGVRFIASAPTHTQARRIFWADLKAMVPRWAMLSEPKESGMSISLITGNEVQVMGMDVPERSEGSPIAHICLDEYGNMKERVWTEHIAPALTDTLGTADFVGVPEGRDHYYNLFRAAQSDEDGEWDAFTWTTAEALPMYLGRMVNRNSLPKELRGLSSKELGKILAEREIASALRRMDRQTYDQEYNGSFVVFAGRAYYAFDPTVHASVKITYDPALPLVFCFDFNVKPGVCVIAQEQGSKTCIVGEVYIPDNSHTALVCKRLLQDWGQHKGLVYVYGDATGGARSTTSSDGSGNWDIVRQFVNASKFPGGVHYKVDRKNPSVISRLNSMNSRIMSADGCVGLLVCPAGAPYTVKDLEGTRIQEGASQADIDKKSDPMLSHLSDALGYYIQKRFPISGGKHNKVEATQW